MAKNRPPMKKKNRAEKTMDHNKYFKIYAQQRQTALKVNHREKKSHQQSPSWYIKIEQKENMKYIMKRTWKKITIFSVITAPGHKCCLISFEALRCSA